MSSKDTSGRISKTGGDKAADAKKPRAQPGDFERQVEQIRKDLDSVRSNLEAAEKALGKTETMNAQVLPTSAPEPASVAAGESPPASTAHSAQSAQ